MTSSDLSAASASPSVMACIRNFGLPEWRKPRVRKKQRPGRPDCGCERVKNILYGMQLSEYRAGTQNMELQRSQVGPRLMSGFPVFEEA
jgi:hypothetical protein